MHRESQERLARLPRITLTERQLFDLELLATGGFDPLTGFLSEKDYNSVVSRMRLTDGRLWPIPIVLDVSSTSTQQVGDEVTLCDRHGNPVAYFLVESRYVPDKISEAMAVYGTTDEKHPGVFYLLNETGDTYLGGSIELISLPKRNDFKELRRTPAEVRALLKEKGIIKVAAFQTRNPIHKAHFELMRRASDEHNVHILIHPVVGLTKEGDIDYATRVRSYIDVSQKHMHEFATLSLLPLAMRMAGPREALWHALIRKNYGATHFIVGRDHAGPGNNSKGEPFYDPYAAQTLAKSLEKELGLTIIAQEEMVYVDDEVGYVPASKVPVGKQAKNISGTQVREMLRNGQDIPDWFSFSEVVDVLRQGVRNRQQKGFAVFFTGLPSSGKSTIAEQLRLRLIEMTNREITMLDGDVVRQHLSRGLGFSREDRELNVERIGFVAGEIVRHGGIVICAAVAPYARSREVNRRRIEHYGGYIEVYVSTPLSVCEARDPKGLYAKARMGIASAVTGIDDPYEVPRYPDLNIDNSAQTIEEAVEHVVDLLKKRGIL